jgi:hypothetical protein
MAALNAPRTAEVATPTPTPTALPHQVTPSAPPQNPTQAAGSSNIELIPLAGANDPPPQTQPERPDPSDTQVRPTRSSGSAPRPDATLDVGVVPWGKIWIDNRLYGWTPLRGIKLHPGRHLIGAGVDSSQQVRKHINLKPGEQAVLTLQLDGSGGGDEATGSHNDR